MRHLFTLLLLMLFPMACAHGNGPETDHRRTVEQFDLQRYLGDWYEIARFDHRFERGLEEVRATYRLTDEGNIEVINSGLDTSTGTRQTAIGKAHATDKTGQLKVSFFWIFYSEYNVLALGDEYDWALVGSRSTKYLWILSRTPQLPRATLDRIVELARARGYDTDRLIYVRQTPETATPPTEI